MEIREARSDDFEGIRRTARRSLADSYGHALSDEIIDTVVEEWYDDDGLAAELDDEGTVFLVADDGGVVGFAQCYLVRRRNTVGEVDWLHVDPDHRGGGLGTDLLSAAERELLDRGANHVEGRVLVENENGTRFYEEHGFEATGERRVEVGGGEFDERLYAKFPEEESEAQVLTEARETPDGVVYVALDAGVRAPRGPFYPTYLDRERTRRFGWLCGGCESFNVAMDSMDRIQCNDCGNQRKASRWDAAYL